MFGCGKSYLGWILQVKHSRIVNALTRCRFHVFDEDMADSGWIFGVEGQRFGCQNHRAQIINDGFTRNKKNLDVKIFSWNFSRNLKIGFTD
jgi:hypothetical protein